MNGRSDIYVDAGERGDAWILCEQLSSSSSVAPFNF